MLARHVIEGIDVRSSIDKVRDVHVYFDFGQTQEDGHPAVDFLIWRCGYFKARNDLPRWQTRRSLPDGPTGLVLLLQIFIKRTEVRSLVNPKIGKMLEDIVPEK